VDGWRTIILERFKVLEFIFYFATRILNYRKPHTIKRGELVELEWDTSQPKYIAYLFRSTTLFVCFEVIMKN
jgi:hypothetical protein